MARGAAAKRQRAANGGASEAGAGGTAREIVRGYRLLRVPLATGLPVSRGLLVKRHESRDKEERELSRRSLFVTHVDGLATEAQLARCFSTAFGPVEKVEMKMVEKKAPKAQLRADGVRTSVNYAHVVFKDEESVDKVLSAATGRLVGTAVLPPPASELREALRASKDPYRDPAELRREVDSWMADYDLREEEKRRIARESAVDDDGFTKVVSGITRTADGTAIRAAKRPDLKTGAFSEPIKTVQASSGQGVSDYGEGTGGKKKKKSREMPDFYRFQLREKKRQEIADYQTRKAEDTEKVEYMRKKKKFKVSA
eukprot:TRINITY_DN1753_c0_g2_i1.p1 TRINITY_DN1753_c0_g2~~TRINITY_DN1753_c0_g2_i1.p1  ORF type:complete len:335 (+),score=78.90 TRINITY_DN1753_c0_g2_i1:69-1007(+)